MDKIVDGIIYSDDMSAVLGVESKSIKTARIADGVKIIESEVFKDCTELTEVYLPSSIERIWYQVWKNCKSLLTVHLGSDFGRLETKWFKFLPEQFEFDCEKDSKTYKLIKRSSVLRAHIKELSMVTAKNEKSKQVQKVSAEALLSTTFEQYEETSYQLVASRKSGIIVQIALRKFCGVFSFGTDYEKWLGKIPKIIELFSDQAKSGEEVFALLKKNKLSLAELPSNKQPNIKLNADGNLILFAKGKLYPLKLANLKSIEVFGIKSLEPCAFKEMKTLESVKLTDGLETMGYLAFSRCSALKSVIIPEGITKIEWATFANCSSLTSVNLPSSVERIERDAFEDCEALESIFVPSTIQEIEKDAFKNTRIMNLGTFTIKSNDYRVMDGKRLYNGAEDVSFTIKDGLAFCGNELLYPAIVSDTITIPEGTSAICDDAFQHCLRNVKTLFIPKSIRSIGKQAFFFFDVESIEYAGTVKEWALISKGYKWNCVLSVDCVHCSDGVAVLEKSEL